MAFRITQITRKKKTLAIGITCLAVFYLTLVFQSQKKGYIFVKDVWFQYTERRALSQKGNTVKQRLEEQAKKVRENCDKVKSHYILRNDENSVKQNLITDRARNLVYCSVEKIGSTFWRRVFQILGDKSGNSTDPFSIREVDAFQGYETLSDVTFDEIYRLLHGSTKFMFTREPYERLFSGYVDKLYAPNSMYWSYIGRYVIDHFRKEASNASRQCGHDVTFAEFVQYIIHSQEKNARRDPHFLSTYEHCRPCEIQYDYVGKMKNFKEDSFGILEIHKLSKFVKFENFRKETERDAIMSTLDWFYNLKPDVIKCMSLVRAVFRAWRKLQIRGIISKNVKFPFSLDSIADLKKEEVAAAFLKAHEASGNASERKKNKDEAFLQAYSEVSPQLLDQLRDALFVDSTLFGYDAISSKLLRLKNNPVRKFDFRYFDFSQ